MLEITPITDIPTCIINKELATQTRLKWIVVLELVLLLPAGWAVLHYTSLSVYQTGGLLLFTVVITYGQIKDILNTQKRLSQPGQKYKGNLIGKLIVDELLKDGGEVSYYLCFENTLVKVFPNKYTQETEESIFLRAEAYPHLIVELEAYPSLQHALLTVPLYPERDKTSFVRTQLTTENLLFLRQQENRDVKNEAELSIKETKQTRILHKEKRLASWSFTFGKEKKRYTYKWATHSVTLTISEDQFGTSKAGDAITINRLPKTGFVWFETKDE